MPNYFADYDTTAAMLKYFMEKTVGNSKPAAMICVPSGVTEVEKRAFYDVINDSSIKAKEIKIVDVEQITTQMLNIVLV